MSQLFSEIFSGSYVFRRQVSLPQLTIEGHAYFEPMSFENTLYTERGYYQLNGVSRDCFQKRIYRWSPSRLSILKEDKQCLHEFDFVHDQHYPIILKHTHRCQEDLYKLILDISTVDQFSTFYLIQGPSKNYMISTLFTRQF